MIDKKLKIILLGAPGSGKGTLAQGLVNKGFIQISTGDLFRKKVQEDSDEARELQKMINNGELIPDSVTNNLAREAILDASKKNKHIILDGYPRTTDQAKYLETISLIDYVLYLNVDEKTLFERITGRLSCKQCQRIYNEFTNPPKNKEVCDDCNLPLFKRRDDNKESFEKRMREYNEKTSPLIDFYKNNNDTKFIEVKQEPNESIEDVLNKVISYLNI